MKIQELELTHDLRNMWRPQDILEKYGWKVLGWGVEGAVAEHPTKPYVLKLYSKTSKYSRFVEFVQANQSSPYLPRFGRYVRKLPGSRLSYVRMEKLNPVSEDELLTTYLPQMAVLSWLGIQRGIEGVGHRLSFDVDMQVDKKGLSLGDPSTNLDTIQTRLGKVSPEWVRVCGALLNHAGEIGIQGGLDLHAGNFMKRGGVLVIIDPYV